MPSPRTEFNNAFLLELLTSVDLNCTLTANNIIEKRTMSQLKFFYEESTFLGCLILLLIVLKCYFRDAHFHVSYEMLVIVL